MLIGFQNMSASSSRPPFPWSEKGAATTAGPSDLLKRVKEFLPQIQAANAAAIVDGTRRLDDGLVVKDNGNDDNMSNEPNDDKETKPMVKKKRVNDSDDDENEDEAQETEATTPTIQLDLTLGVDANHPAVALLGKEEDDDGNAQQNNTNGNEVGPGRAEQAIQSLLKRPATTAKLNPKGPLITEVSED